MVASGEAGERYMAQQQEPAVSLPRVTGRHARRLARLQRDLDRVCALAERYGIDPKELRWNL